MTKSENDGPDWIQAWIEQQREQLRRAGMPGAGSTASGSTASGSTESETRDHEASGAEAISGQILGLGQRWLEAGQSYLQGWQQFAHRAAADATAGEAPLKFGEEMVNGWQGAWAGAASAGEGATRQLAELIARLPTLGLAREHTESWRELLAAQTEFQRLEQELRGVWIKVQADALAMVERLMRERSAAQQNLDPAAPPGGNNYRELYDLWVECGEKIFSQVAHSDSYCKLQAQLGNAAMRLRAGQQALIERALKQFDLPTRSELNTVHKQMRELRERVATLEAQLADARSRGES
jgi:polyhydroxyalkanoate synthesis regulator phasin